MVKEEQVLGVLADALRERLAEFHPVEGDGKDSLVLLSKHASGSEVSGGFVDLFGGHCVVWLVGG